MKNLILLFVFGITLSSYGQQEHYNTAKGYAAEGYDVVSYFDNTATKGNKQFETTHDGVKYKFSSQKNLNTFKAAPEKYIPAYGGYCAYAMGANGEKVSVNPKTFEIRNDKLYLFYNSLGINTLKKWKEDGAADLKEKADKNWKKLVTAQ